LIPIYELVETHGNNGWKSVTKITEIYLDYFYPNIIISPVATFLVFRCGGFET
jgi:hypothetical protein